MVSSFNYKQNQWTAVDCGNLFLNKTRLRERRSKRSYFAHLLSLSVCLLCVSQGSGSSGNLSSTSQCPKHQHGPASQSGRYTHATRISLLQSSCYSDHLLTHWGRILSWCHDLDCSISYNSRFKPPFLHTLKHMHNMCTVP